MASNNEDNTTRQISVWCNAVALLANSGVIVELHPSFTIHANGFDVWLYYPANDAEHMRLGIYDGKETTHRTLELAGMTEHSLFEVLHTIVKEK